LSPPHVTLNAIFAGMMPFMGIQVIALGLLLRVPADRGLWLPQFGLWPAESGFRAPLKGGGSRRLFLFWRFTLYFHIAVCAAGLPRESFPEKT